MNGQHDLGGMQSFGPIPHPHDEPVFHTSWDGRVEALTMVERACLYGDTPAWPAFCARSRHG
jgi:Nitrile hydratase beta subunit